MDGKLKEIILNYSKTLIISIGLVSILSYMNFRQTEIKQDIISNNINSRYLIGFNLDTEIFGNCSGDINCYGIINSDIKIKKGSNLNCNINNYSIFSSQNDFEENTVLNGNLKSRSLFYNKIVERNTKFTGNLEVTGLYNEVLSKIIPYYAKLENLNEYQTKKINFKND